jgi:hypothetical protein
VIEKTYLSFLNACENNLVKNSPETSRSNDERKHLRSTLDLICPMDMISVDYELNSSDRITRIENPKRYTAYRLAKISIEPGYLIYRVRTHYHNPAALLKIFLRIEASFTPSRPDSVGGV